MSVSGVAISYQRSAISQERHVDAGAKSGPEHRSGSAQPVPRSEIRNSQSQDDRLRTTAKQLEGVFVEQLFKAMRETVPTGGVVDGGAGEEVFHSLLDQHLSTQLPGSGDRGLSAAIYRQLRAAVSSGEPSADTLPNAGSGE
jgi:peptidoglycan hydrolase FlgJ